MCVMEAVALVAGEAWGDHPRCASAVIGALLRALNDAGPEDARQALKAVVPWVIGTSASDADELTRSWMILDWHVRIVPSAWLELAGRTTESEALIGVGEVCNPTTLSLLLAALPAARTAARASYQAVAAEALNSSWEHAIAAVGADPGEPLIVEARGRSGAGPVGVATDVAVQAVPVRARWEPDRAAAWRAVWDAAWAAASAVAAAAPRAVVQIQAATGAWGAGWDAARDLDPAAWDHGLAVAQITARDAALTAAWRAGWVAAVEGTDPRPVSARVDAAIAGALAPTATTLRTGLLALVHSLAGEGGEVPVQR